MAKKTPKKQTQLLSPENYIRQKVRNLPVYECLVNTEWESSKMASVVVARMHTNGNITAGFYVVDLFCLGIKNTTYLFNLPLYEYKEQLSKMMDLDLNAISYELAHNIVYAGFDYANELGFDAHKEFRTLTRFILNEDNEDVELIEIECGKDGKPFYMQGRFDSEQMSNRIVNQLERVVGKGNYHFILEDDNDNNGYEKYDEEDEFVNYTFEEKRDLFSRLVKSMHKLNNDDRITLHDLVISVSDELIDEETFDAYYDEYSACFDVEVLPIDEIPFEFWGVKQGDLTISDEISGLFVDAYNLVNESTKKASKKVTELKKLVGDIPAVRLLELMILQVNGKDKKSSEKIVENYELYPEYPVFRLQILLSDIHGLTISKEFIDNTPHLEAFFGDRSTLHEIELMNYILMVLAMISYEKNATKLDAFQCAIDEMDLPESIDKAIYNEVTALKFELVADYLLPKKK